MLHTKPADPGGTVIEQLSLKADIHLVLDILTVSTCPNTHENISNATLKSKCAINFLSNSTHLHH